MNVAVATNERGDSLEIPHTPWPLVHPFPNTEPNPTNSPAKINIGVFALTVWVGAEPDRSW